MENPKPVNHRVVRWQKRLWNSLTIFGLVMVGFALVVAYDCHVYNDWASFVERNPTVVVDNFNRDAQLHYVQVLDVHGAGTGEKRTFRSWYDPVWVDVYQPDAGDVFAARMFPNPMKDAPPQTVLWRIINGWVFRNSSYVYVKMDRIKAAKP